MERIPMADLGDPASLSKQGKLDFAAGKYSSALEKFRTAADGYAAKGDRLNHAEELNNMGVTLLQLGRAGEALDTLTGTESVFAADGDLRRQGIAMNNQAAALEALRRPGSAASAYEKAAQLLGGAGERALQSEALKAAAAVELRRGRVASSGSRMLGALISKPDPSPLERVLKSLLRHI